MTGSLHSLTHMLTDVDALAETLEKGVYWCGGLNTPHESEHTAPRAPPPHSWHPPLPPCPLDPGNGRQCGMGPPSEVQSLPLAPCPCSRPLSSSPSSCWVVWFGVGVYRRVSGAGVGNISVWAGDVCVMPLSSPTLWDVVCQRGVCLQSKLKLQPRSAFLT